MTVQAPAKFQVTRALRLNITAAVLLIILCPLALWQFYFRLEHKESTPDCRKLINNYCAEYNKADFKAATVFAPEIRAFATTHNTTPALIDHDLAVERQTQMYPKLTLLPDSIEVKTAGNNETSVACWINEVYYLKSKMQYRSVDLHCVFFFNKEQKITQLDLLEVKNEKFSSTIPGEK